MAKYITRQQATHIRDRWTYEAPGTPTYEWVRQIAEEHGCTPKTIHFILANRTQRDPRWCPGTRGKRPGCQPHPRGGVDEVGSGGSQEVHHR